MDIEALPEKKARINTLGPARCQCLSPAGWQDLALRHSLHFQGLGTVPSTEYPRTFRPLPGDRALLKDRLATASQIHTLPAVFVMIE